MFFGTLSLLFRGLPRLEDDGSKKMALSSQNEDDDSFLMALLNWVTR